MIPSQHEHVNLVNRNNPQEAMPTFSTPYTVILEVPLTALQSHSKGTLILLYISYSGPKGALLYYIAISKVAESVFILYTTLTPNSNWVLDGWRSGPGWRPVPAACS